MKKLYIALLAGAFAMQSPLQADASNKRTTQTRPHPVDSSFNILIKSTLLGAALGSGLGTALGFAGGKVSQLCI